MTAVNIAIQKRAVHIMTDGLSYNKEGIVVEVSPKCWALPSLNAAVACMGPSLANIITAAEFTKRFSSFDEMIAGLEEAMPKIYIANRAVVFRTRASISAAGPKVATAPRPIRSSAFRRTLWSIGIRPTRNRKPSSAKNPWSLTSRSNWSRWTM